MLVQRKVKVREAVKKNGEQTTMKWKRERERERERLRVA